MEGLLNILLLQYTSYHILGEIFIPLCPYHVYLISVDIFFFNMLFQLTSLPPPNIISVTFVRFFIYQIRLLFYVLNLILVFIKKSDIISLYIT